MLDRVISTIRENNMISCGDEVSVALSGGADSVCLLLVLNSLKESLGITLSALHVNHCLRGKESDRDEQFCADLCSRLGISLIHRKFDVSGYALEHHMSTELAAREIRYSFFAENTSGKKLATAHNANDNAETVIFNLVRGTGIKGISGIPPVRDNIIRPLINISREEIEQYLGDIGQNFVTDSSNLTDDYTRNKIRHNVIPLLREINPALFRTIASDSDNFRLDSSFLELESDKAYSECLSDPHTLTGLSSYHKAVRRRCIARFLRENGIETGHALISRTDDMIFSGGKANLSGDLYLISENDVLRTEIIKPDEELTEYQTALHEGENLFMNKKIIVIVSSEYPENCDAVLDTDCIKGTLAARNRRPGDRIKLKGNSFTSSVKKLFNRNVPKNERNSICFICDSTGPVYIEKTGYADGKNAGENCSSFTGIRILSNVNN